MAKGFTYTAIGSDGKVFTRYSEGHTEPRYVAAVINCGTTAFSATEFNARRELAKRKTLFASLDGVSPLGTKYKPPELVTVTAVAGRAKR